MNGPISPELAQQMEAYLLGEMSADQAQAFEATAGQHPALAEELSLQREIVSAIQSTRRMELKANLARISVSPTANPLAGWRGVTMGVATAALVAGGVWLYLSQNTSQTDPTLATNQEIIQPAHPQSPSSSGTVTLADENASKSSVAQSSASPGGTSELEAQATPSTQEPRHATIAQSVEQTAPAAAVTPKVAKTFKASDGKAKSITTPDVDAENQPGIQRGELEQLPSGQIVAESEVRTRPEVIIKPLDHLAYQYFDNKLYLYGSFGDAIYELIELNSAQFGRKLYVYHKEAFYALDNNTRAKTDMEPITDADLEAELTLLRKKRVD